MEQVIIRSMLLKRDLFEDNEYLQKYCDLMEENRFRDAEKFKTNVHHIIPKHVFKKANLSYDDTSKNKINLLFKDHILAHYYLYMCSKDDSCKKDNDKAIRCLVKYDWKKMNLLEKLEGLQEEYEAYMPLVSVEVKQEHKIKKLLQRIEKLDVVE